jgi:photosystem II stability/assembly factor-like uncharacterized protein
VIPRVMHVAIAREALRGTLVTMAVALALVASACSSRQPVGVRESPAVAGDSATESSPPTTPSSPLPAAPISQPTASAHPVPTGFTPASVTFGSANTGFVLGTAPCDAGTCTTLVTTSDAGRGWSFVAELPPSIGGDDPAVSKVRFANPKDGWVFGAQLWSTHDRGHSWKRITQAGPVVDLEASAGVAYEISGTRVLRTAVGSDAWVPVPGLTPAVGPGEIALHGHAVWIATGSRPGGSRLVTSSDGATWRTIPDPCAGLGADWTLGGVAPVDSTRIFLLCVGSPGAGSESKHVLFSTDAGAHATPAKSDAPRGGVTDGGDFAAASASVVAIAARSGASKVYRSADGGTTWQAPLYEGDGGVGYFDLGFTTPTQGVVVYGQPGGPASSKLLMTRDAGATWAPVTF